MQGKLNRNEMKNIIAGYRPIGGGGGKSCNTDCVVSSATYACYSDKGDNTNCYCPVQGGAGASCVAS